VDEKVVSKTIIKYKEYDVFQREIFWLKLFEQHDFLFTPRIIDIDYNNLCFKMTYCGQPITKNTLPPNWRLQVYRILKSLGSVNCRHNDMKSDEILVNDDKIYMCDFGWASLENDFTLGIGLNAKVKPHGICSNEKIYEIIDCL
jgi:tRNA A-37 threonylcarbamoyl transferase component Bud32